MPQPWVHSVDGRSIRASDWRLNERAWPSVDVKVASGGSTGGRLLSIQRLGLWNAPALADATG